MKPIYLLPLLLALSVAPYTRPPSVCPAMAPRPDMYELAEAETGAPAEILRGIAFAESSLGRNTAHPDPHDRGWFGLHETYHAERATQWGEYDADDPCEAAVIAGHVLMSNYHELGDMDKAIAAYRQGVAGVNRDGATMWYVERVRRER